MGMSVGSGNDLKADINVTPLVDVVLVLLIIFMVVTPMLKQGVAVQLPETSHGKELQEDKKENIVVAIKDDGSIYVEGEKVEGADKDTPENRAELESRIRLALQAGKTKPLLIKADARLKYGQVKRVMDLVKEKIPLRMVKLASDRSKPAEEAAQ
jgi:biopolymer transport protein TolR